MTSSLLFVPGDEPRKLGKARALAGTGVIVDLEDAVAPEHKSAARAALGGIEDAGAVPGALLVRINGLRTPLWYDDASAALAAGVTDLVVPKVEDPADLAMLDAALTEIESGRGRANGSTRLLLLVETALGVARMDALLGATPRTRSATLGLADLCLDLGIAWETAMAEPPLFVDTRTQLALLSRAHGLEPPWDPVYLRIDDAAGLRADARLGRRMGAQGKLAIHPSQIGVIDAVFRPTAAELARAARVVEAFAAAAAAGRGAAAVDGMLVDEPVVAHARRLLGRVAGAGGSAVEAKGRTASAAPEEGS